MPLKDGEWTDAARKGHAGDIAFKEKSVWGEYAESHFKSSAKGLFLHFLHKLAPLLYGLIYGAYIQEHLLRKIIDLTVKYHVESAYCLLYADHCTLDSGELLCHGEWL